MEVQAAIVIVSKYLSNAPKAVIDAFHIILEALYKYSGESREAFLKKKYTPYAYEDEPKK